MAIRFQVLSGRNNEALKTTFKPSTKRSQHKGIPRCIPIKSEFHWNIPFFPSFFPQLSKHKLLRQGGSGVCSRSILEKRSKVHPFFAALHAWHHYLPLLVPCVSIYQCWWWSSAAVAGYFAWVLFRNTLRIRKKNTCFSRWWFQTFFIFTPT